MSTQTREWMRRVGVLGLVAALVVAGPLYAGPGSSPAAGLVSYWSFEDSLIDVGFLYTSHSGAARDDLAARSGAARFAAGRVGKAAAIGAAGGDPLWLSAPSTADIDLPGTYTIEAWIFPTLLDEQWQRMVLRWEGQFSYHFALRLVGATWMVSQFHQQSNGTNVNADGGAVVANAWYHVAAVADGTAVRVYLNGVQVASVAYDGTTKQGTNVGVGVGDMSGGNGSRFNGYIDELAMWNVALTPEQILSHWEAGPDGYGLVLSCEEQLDSVSISGPGLGSVGEPLELTASLSGVDEGATAAYAWTLVSGSADLGPTDGPVLSVTPTAVGNVVVSVAAGDGLCYDIASATRSFQALPGGGPGMSPASGLVSYYRFDESTSDNGADFIHHSGTTADNLTPRSGTDRFVAGVKGQAAAVGAGVGDPVWYNAPVSPDIDLPPTYTIETWIHPTDLSGDWQRLALRWGSPLSYHFALRRIGANWTVSLFHGQTSGTPNADGGNVVLGQWQHIAGVADGTMIRTYLNGIQVASAAYNGTIGSGGAEGLGIGDSFAGNSGMSFNGYLDEFAVWNVALTPEQLLSHYEAGRAGYGLVEGCLEEADSVTISGLAYGAPGEILELESTLSGIDGGGSLAYAWELVEGTAALGPTDGPTLSVTLGDSGFVEVRVSAGDGVCDDIATATHRIQILPAGGPGTSPDAGLVALWSFDENEADVGAGLASYVGVADDDLTAREGAARRVPGVVGGALAIGRLEGDALRLDAPSSPDIEVAATYTVEAWIYPTELSSAWQRLVLRWGGAGQNSYHFAIRNEAGFVNAVSLFHAQSSGAEVNTNGGTVLGNRWQHVAGVADGTMIRVYLDGAEVAASPYDGTLAQGTGQGLGLAESATSFAPALRFNGLIDEVALWNVALTPAEILSHYRAGVDGYGLEEAPPTAQVGGDCDQDGERTIGDLICQVRLLYQGFYLLDRTVQQPPCSVGGPGELGNLAVLDTNGDIRFDVSDVVYLANFLFVGGGPPVQGLGCFDVPWGYGCPESPTCP